ncbi:MAG: hypothetical protein DRQ44_00135 [Gammaproteobacteria bacterium]|nr:MAG: hypothetical protein DRQ44_00135 [Gammaproteobacteria bacterium]
MRNPIHLHTLEHLEIKASSKRLNLFPGRSMSETAFDKSQNYVADRIAPLLSGVWPGIQQGLEVEYLSKEDQVASGSAQSYTPGMLTEMAYDSYSPAYPADEIMPGYKHLRGNYGVTLSAESAVAEESEVEEIQALFRVKEGSAVTASGTVVKLFNPLEMKWTDLIARSGLTSDKNITGLYMLCLGREIIPVDYDEAPACRRHETDPARDTRFETVGYLTLQPVENFLYNASDLVAKHRHKTINRFLSKLIIGPMKPLLPNELSTLGLVAMKQQKPVWFEANGCRFMSEHQGLPLAMLSHTEQVFKELIATNKKFKPVTALNKLVKSSKNIFQVLPAAGSFPRALLSNVASIDSPLPAFAIDYPGLRVDMMPVPASGVAGILRRELSRGVINFTETSEERLRLLIAVPDGDFHPNLLDVPVSDKALSAQLYDYGMQAYNAWIDWRVQLGKLFSQIYDETTYTVDTDSKLSADELAKLGLPDLSQDQFDAPLVPANPELLNSVPDKPSDYKSEYFFDGLIFKRGESHSATSYKRLPPPYRESVPESEEYTVWLNETGDQLPVPENEVKPGLIIRRAELEKDIVNRIEELEQAHDFVDRINDLLLLQRQQLDAQSVSFATFAGGVAGDGSGLQLTRWLPFTSFEPTTKSEVPPAEPDAGGDGGDTGVVINADVGKDFSVLLKAIGAAGLPASDSHSYYSQPAFSAGSPFGYDTSAYTPSISSFSFAERESYIGNFNITNSTPTQDFQSQSFQSSGSSFPLLGYQSNNAYAQLAVQNVTTSNYEAVSKLNSAVGKLGLLNIGSSPLTKGAFTSSNQNFGVLKHIPLFDKELENSHQAVSDLQSDIDELLVEINSFINDDLPQHIKDKASAISVFSLVGRLSLPVLSTLESDIAALPEVDRLGKGNALRYGHLFKANRSLVKEISGVDRIRNKLVKIQKVLQKYIAKQQIKLDEADSNIIAERKNLTQLDAVRREALEDYSAAQRLVIEHWQAVEEKFDQRNKILNEMLGLYYVKVRETAISVSLPNVHSLSYAEAGDLVPGCRSDDRNQDQISLPDELDVFFDAVLDIPMIHWRPLSVLTHKLPGRYRLMSMLERRGPRLQSKQNQLSRNFTSRIRGFSELRRQTLFVMHSFSERRYKSVHSLKNLQLEAANVLSLEDLLNNSAGGRLRKPAQQLSNDLQLACSCLLEKLNDLPPSVRLTWGQLAEDDQLPIDYPEKWPDIDKAEDVSFNSLRTCLELVSWFNRQLSKRAEGDSHTALTNLIRACLMLAASDDPGDLLEGQLQVSPGVLRLGNVLRLSLNQEAVPGAMLQLLDAKKKVVALLRLDDQDNDGASATVINLLEEKSDFNNQQFMVIGHKYKHV